MNPFQLYNRPLLYVSTAATLAVTCSIGNMWQALIRNLGFIQAGDNFAIGKLVCGGTTATAMVIHNGRYSDFVKQAHGIKFISSRLFVALSVLYLIRNLAWSCHW